MGVFWQNSELVFVRSKVMLRIVTVLLVLELISHLCDWNILAEL